MDSSFLQRSGLGKLVEAMKVRNVNLAEHRKELARQQMRPVTRSSRSDSWSRPPEDEGPLNRHGLPKMDEGRKQRARRFATPARATHFKWFQTDITTPAPSNLARKKKKQEQPVKKKLRTVSLDELFDGKSVEKRDKQRPSSRRDS